MVPLDLSKSKIGYLSFQYQSPVQERSVEMKNAKMVFSCGAFLLVFFFSSLVWAQPTSSQTVGGVTRQQTTIDTERELQKTITTERPEGIESTEEEIMPEDTGPRTLIKKIQVEGATLLSFSDIYKITSRYEGQEISFRTMQKVADLLTDEYRKKGYATSRAYIPPQRISANTLVIRVVEGKLGEVEIRGNKHFKTELIRKKLDVRPRGYFDYSALQQSLVYINEHPDRVAKAVLVPGAEPGTTDLIIDVEDRLPFHYGFEYDNYASRYVGEDRFAGILEHNNLLGFDDKIFFKLQHTDSSELKLAELRYLYPISSGLEIGGYFLRSSLRLGEEFKDLDATGKSYIYGIFLNKALITEATRDLRLSLGFDYKKVTNKLAGEQSSRDALRVLKTGLEYDFNDKLGRNILLGELDWGIDDILGGMAEKDPHASRTGAGAKFTKGVFTAFRLQPMPWETTLLWKNFAQYSNYTLAAAEEFQIGGPVSVRGYPPAEHSGDKGWYTSLEYSIPFYFLKEKEKKVPFTKDVNLYDALRFVTFFDWAEAHKNTIQAGEEKHETLKGIGCGVRLNVRDNVAIRVELGWPLGGETPSDGDHMHPWIEVVTRF